MAFGLQYTVFDGAGSVPNGDPLQEGVVAVGGGSLQSAAITGSDKIRRFVRIFVDTDAFVTWGENPTALNDGTQGRAVAAGTDLFWHIEAGHKIAVIQRT